MDIGKIVFGNLTYATDGPVDKTPILQGNAVDKIAELQGRITELLTVADSYQQSDRILRDENVALRAEVAALRQDAARYRWLRPRLYSIDFNYADSGVSVIAFEAPKHQLGPGIALDAAIDAALAAQKD